MIKKRTKKLLLFLLAIIATLCMAFGLSACSSCDGSTVTPSEQTDPDNDPEEGNNPEDGGSGTTHTYDGYEFDAEGHWQICTECGEETAVQSHTLVNGVCSVCGVILEGTESLEYTLSAQYQIGSDSLYEVSGITDDTVTDIVIPSFYNSIPVAVGSSAFENNTKIKSVTIGNGVTGIYSDAFSGCTSLASINIPDSVIVVYNDAFDGTALYNDESNWQNGVLYIDDCLITAKLDISGDYTVKDGTKVIAWYAFYECHSLSGITIPDSVTSIGGYAFYYCDFLSDITIGSGVRHIGWYAFVYTAYYDNPNNWEDDVLYIGNYLINAKTYMVCDYEIKDGTLVIADCAFSTSRLTSVTIPDSVITIGNMAFCNGEGWSAASSGWESITIPDSVTYIGYGAFAGCYFTSLTIPDSVRYLGEGAFAGCSSLTSLTIGSGIKEIIGYAFEGCSSLTSVTIPDNIKKIGNYGFANCGSLTEVNFGSGLKTIGDSAFVACYSITSIVIPDNVTTIGNNAFFKFYDYEEYAKNPYSSALTSVVIGNGVETIGYGAFRDCEALADITIGSNVTSIGSNVTSIGSGYSVSPFYGTAYYNDESNWEDGVLYIGEYLIAVKSTLSGDYTIKDGTKVIADYAFYNCTSLTSVTIPSSVAAIGENAFYNYDSTENLAGTTITFETAGGSAEEKYIDGNLYSGDGTTLISYDSTKTETSFTIPDGVTTIGARAFYNCTNLTSITIPASVTAIEGSAFYGCSSLTAVYITDLAAWCAIEFSGYTSNPLYYAGNLYLNGALVTNLVIPDGVTSIGDYAFYYCTSITSITIPASVTYIGYDAFYRCNNLTAVYITDLAAWCAIEFSGYRSNPLYYAGNLYLNGELVTELVIPDTVTSIGDYAFYGCTSITSVTVPASVTYIGEYAFNNCSALTGVYITDLAAWCAIEYYDGSYFDYYSNPLYYAGNLYLNNELVTELVIPDGVTSIGAYAFYGCTSITSVTVPSSVTYVGNYAFSGCTSLESVYITDLAAWCGINFDGEVAYMLSNPLYYADNLYVNGELVTELVIPDSVTYIGRYAFFGAPVTSVTIGENVKTIREGAFARSSTLTSVTLSDSVTTIGRYAFVGCTSLTSITIGAGVTAIFDYAFVNPTFSISSGLRNCYITTVYITDLAAWCGIGFGNEYSNPLRYASELYLNGELVTALVIPDGVTTIKDYAFYYSSAITSVTIPDSVTKIGRYAFYNCSNLTNVTTGNGVTAIGKYAFYGCSALTDLTIGNGVTEIGSYAFYDCSALTDLTLGGSITTIADTAFGNCNSLANITIDASNTNYKLIDGNLYSYDGTALIKYAAGKTDESFTIPDGVTTIGGYAFDNCANLTSITIPSSITAIESSAFYGCSSLTAVYITDLAAWCGIEFDGGSSNPLCYAGNLYLNGELVTELVIPDTVTSIGEYAFYYCTSITSVTIPASVTAIGNYAFYNCTNLTCITIPASVTAIGNYAFSGCIALTSVTIGNGVTEIGSYAFYACSALADLTIGSGVTTIGRNAFYYCNALTSIYYNGTAEAWAAITFSNSSSDPTYYGATVYYYAANDGTTTAVGNYWYYDADGSIKTWSVEE